MTDGDMRMVRAAYVRAGRFADAARLLPAERTYPLSPALARQVGAEPGHPAAAHTAAGAR